MRIQIGPLDLVIGRKAADTISYPPSGFVTNLPSNSWWPFNSESFSGAWQRGIQVPVQNALTHPTFWACVTLIASDIAKGGLALVQEQANGITEDVENAAFSPVLRQPNHYQNRIQFIEYWILSKLCHGNTYALKVRDKRNVVTDLYLLNATTVRPMVGPSGEVFYSIGQDVLNGVDEASVVVPAREIIHDRFNTMYHPLCGLSPVYASGHAALQALKVMSNATKLAQQGFRPGGVVTAATPISADNAKKFEDMWEAQYSGPEHIGRVVFLGGGLKFEKPPVMTAVDAQVIDQLKWDDEKVCSTLKVPPYMVGVGPPPNYNNIEALNQQYYSQCLQILIESLELCLEEGLGTLEAGYEIEYDIDALLRMDSATKMKAVTDGVKGGIYTPNEGRKKFNKKPLEGGDTVYLQDQDHSLEYLSNRDALAIANPQLPPTVTPPPPPPPVKSTVLQFRDKLRLKALEAGVLRARTEARPSRKAS